MLQLSFTGNPLLVEPNATYIWFKKSNFISIQPTKVQIYTQRHQQKGLGKIRCHYMATKFAAENWYWYITSAGTTSNLQTKATTKTGNWNFRNNYIYNTASSAISFHRLLEHSLTLGPELGLIDRDSLLSSTFLTGLIARAQPALPAHFLVPFCPQLLPPCLPSTAPPFRLFPQQNEV